MSAPNPIPAAHPVAPPPPAPPPKSKLPVAIGAVALVAFIVIAAFFVVPDWYSESTDDAYVEAHLTTVIAKVPAYVQTLHVDDNATVKNGELLVELDPRDYVVAVDVARANLEAEQSKRKEADTRVGIAEADAEQARAELAVARANAVLADANLKRLHSVADARAVSNERVDTATAAFDGSVALSSASADHWYTLRAETPCASRKLTCLVWFWAIVVRSGSE